MPIQMRRQLKREWSVTTAILTQELIVEPNFGGSHHAAEVDEHALALETWRQFEMTTIERNEFIFLIVKAMPRQHFVCMGNGDLKKLAIIEKQRVSSWYNFIAIKPVVIERKDST